MPKTLSDLEAENARLRAALDVAVEAQTEAVKILHYGNGGTMLECVAAAGAVLDEALAAIEAKMQEPPAVSPAERLGEG